MKGVVSMLGDINMDTWLRYSIPFGAGTQREGRISGEESPSGYFKSGETTSTPDVNLTRGSNLTREAISLKPHPPLSRLDVWVEGSILCWLRQPVSPKNASEAARFIT